MTICNVLTTLSIDGNTAILVDGPRKLFKNGIGILDESGTPFTVLSVGMDQPIDVGNNTGKTSLLIEGQMSSKKIYL